MRCRHRVAAAGALVTLLMLSLPTPAHAAAQIDGSGSTWSAIAVTQWAADVARNGLSVNYQPNGSSAGRNFYIVGQYDFAVSEIPFQPTSYDREGNRLDDEQQRASVRPYAYLPVVAGGTSFMYQLNVNGQRINDLRLSGSTITKIFTGAITNWSDPAIAADDGRRFPSMPIIPVVRSDGSGTSAQFSAYMANMFGDIWNPFCSRELHLPSPCPGTSLYPIFAGSKAQSGSDGVANFVAAPYNNGSITYVEYGYALERRFPVVSVLNQAGYYVQPTAENVAIALTRARINPDRTQVLNDVYRNPDNRTYPVSSYSYMIVPTTTAAPFSTEKGDSLGKFILYFLCTGQQKAKQLGYSPLPPNLVQFGFDAVRQIPGAPAPPPLEQCANPTITGEFNLANAPQPPASARAGTPRGAAAATRRTTSGAAATGSTDTSVVTAEELLAAAAELEASNQEAAVENAAPASVAGGRDAVPVGVYAAVAFLILLIVFGPPFVSAALRRPD